MSAVLGLLKAGVKGAGLIDDISAVAGGVLDGVLIDVSPIAFLAKNFIIPVLAYTAPIPIPNGLKHESEGMLGFLAYLLLKPR